MNGVNRGIFRLLPVFLLLFLGVSSCSQKEERRILVIHSYEETYAAYPEFNRMIAEQFEKEKIDADIRTVYLDCESYWEEPELERMRFLVDSVSKDWRPEVILVNEDQATYSLMKCGILLAKEVPVVFGGVNYPNWGLLKHHPNVTGFHDKIAFNENISVAKELFGEHVRLFTMLDTTYIDRQIRRDAKEQFKGHKVTGFIDNPELSPEEQIRLAQEEGYTRFMAIPLRNARNHSDATFMWVLNRSYRDQCYIQLKRDYTTINIGSICGSPSLTAINEAFGFGEKLLGGYITSLPIQVEEEVKTAVRILHGASPSDIPIVESRKEYVVDWNTMTQIGLSKESIPANYRIINIPFRDEYPFLWGALVASFVLFLILLFASLWWLYLREQMRKKQALIALADEKETLSLAIEGGMTYAWRLDKGCFVFEDAFWASQGLNPRQLSFKEFMSFIHPDHWEGVKFNWRNLKSAHKKIVQELCNFDGKGYQWWEFRYTTKQLSGGEYKTAGLLLNIQDIKDREEELEAARLLAEKAELKQSFLANMSHEIRTPLNAIVGFSSLMQGEELSQEERAEYCAIVVNNSEMLLTLLNDILDISSLECGKIRFNYSAEEIVQICQHILMTTAHTCQPGVEGRLECAVDSYMLTTDVHRLSQILINLLTNAAKFTSEGSIVLGVEICPEQNEVLFSVTDTGPGIPLDKQEMIFNRFEKLDGNKKKGTGLGLAICRQIAMIFGGRIWVDPTYTGGARFIFAHPIGLRLPEDREHREGGGAFGRRQRPSV